MIFTSPDYLTKYSDTLSEIIELASIDQYSEDFIEQTLSHSKFLNDFEYSDVTEISFRSTMSLYREMFPNSKAVVQDIRLFSNFYWIGEMYIHLFLKYKLTFETLFAYFPLNKMKELFPLYHEMDVTQFEKYANEVLKESTLSIWLKKRNVLCTKLAKETGISLNTIRAIKSGNRKIEKLQSSYLEKISSYLNVNPRSLLNEITLKIYIPSYDL